MPQDNQLAVRTPMPFEEMEKLAVAAAQSGMFGIKNKEQALCLFAICRSEGLDPIMALKRYHIIENKPSMRADAMAADFMKEGGAILWHVRNDGICAATFFADKAKLNDASRTRAGKRFDLLWKFESEEDATERAAITVDIAKLSYEGEETILRTYGDAEDKGLTTSWKKDDKTQEYSKKTKVNWEQSPRQMLTARVITEGVRLVNPGLIAGVYSPDEIQDIVREEDEFVQEALAAPKARDRNAIQAMIDQYVADAETANPTEKSRLLGLASELRCKLDDMNASHSESSDKEKPHHEAPARSTDALVESAEPELTLKGEPEPIKIPWQDYVIQHAKSKVLRGKRLGNFTAEEISVIHEKTKYALESPDQKIRAEASYIQEAHEAHEAAKKGEQS